MPPNRPSNVRAQITRHAYYWFRQSPWWLNHQTKSSKSIKKVITYAHSTQKYSSPHANLTKYLMRHTSHAHSTQPYSTPHANLTKYLMRHTIHARSITKTNFTLQKTDLKTTNFPKVLSPFRKSSIQTTICIDQQTTNSCYLHKSTAHVTTILTVKLTTLPN